MKTALLGLLLALLAGAPATAGPGQHHPARAWRGFGGPAYLGRLPRRPAQHVLDSLAAAARHRPAKWVAIPSPQRPQGGVAPSY